MPNRYPSAAEQRQIEQFSGTTYAVFTDAPSTWLKFSSQSLVGGRHGLLKTEYTLMLRFGSAREVSNILYKLLVAFRFGQVDWQPIQNVGFVVQA